MPDSLAPDAVEPLLRGAFGRPYLYEPACTSSQDLIDPSLPDGAVAVCDEQTAGRGRLGRLWHAPPGTSILCSLLLRPPPHRRVPELSLVGGMAAADAVERALGLAAQIKWPNDVMVNRRKVAGVLAERRDEPSTSAPVVVLGIGINVNQRREELSSEGRVPAASLRTIDGTARERAPILATLLAQLELYYERWTEGGVEGIYDFLGARDFLRGRRVAADGAHGYALGIDREGRLAIEVDGERVLVESGEVTYER
ncbi:MAG: biotin--[acetyl-CoA-carboxylase] ligase [Actinomycetota bacterium]|nr:biotin--[acetyl-CoA-carboxylase] ligase [Actinomycetota bacterium]